MNLADWYIWTVEIGGAFIVLLVIGAVADNAQQIANRLSWWRFRREFRREVKRRALRAMDGS